MNWATTSHIPTICQLIKEVREQIFEARQFFIDFSKVFDSIHKKKMEQFLRVCDHTKETATAVMMLYKNTNSIRSVAWW